MAYTEKFQHMADIVMSEVASVLSEHVNKLLAQGAVALAAPARKLCMQAPTAFHCARKPMTSDTCSAD